MRRNFIPALADARRLDFLQDAEEYKFHWALDVRTLERVELFPPAIRGVVSCAAVQTHRTVRRFGRRLIETVRRIARGSAKRLPVNDRLLWSRRFVRAALARTLGPFVGSDDGIVLGYHRVVERFDLEAPLTMPSSLVSVAMLERHLDCVGRQHEFASLDEIGARLATGERPRRPLAAVTFDDGYRDVYENAFPMLIRKGIPAAVFLVSDLVGTDRPQTHDRVHSLIRAALRVWTRPSATLQHRLASAEVPEARRIRVPETIDPFAWTRVLLTSLPQRSLQKIIQVLENEFGGQLVPEGFLPLTWEMVAAMHKAGITIGSHTRSHALLTNESSARVFEEVASSRREIERRLNAPVVHFAYPDGKFNNSAVRAVRLAGYQYAYITCEHSDRRQPMLTIPRRILWEYSAVDMRKRFVPALLRLQQRGWLLGRRACTRQSHA